MRIREQPLITLVLVLALIGLVIACYLTYVHYNHDALICTTGGCETVQQSDYATITGIPVALFGVGMFLTLIVLALLRLMDRAFISFEHATIAAWVLVAAGVMYYVYLTYLEVFVLEAICQWCVASSVITLAILAVESVHIWRVLDLDDLDDDAGEPSQRLAQRRDHP